MANTVTLSWKLPAVSPRQRAIKHVQVDFRVKATPALPWTSQDRVSAGSEQKLVFSDVSPGTFEYRLTVVDVGDVSSKSPPVVEAMVGFDDPSDVTDVQVLVG